MNPKIKGILMETKKNAVVKINLQVQSVCLIGLCPRAYSQRVLIEGQKAPYFFQ